MSPKPSISRRSFVKRVGAVGALPLAQVSSDNGDTDRLPELKDKYGVVQWMDVPSQWNEHRQRAERVCENLRERNANSEGVIETGLIAAPETYGGKRGFEVEIGVQSDRLNVELPDHEQNVPVSTVETEAPAELCYNSTYNGIKGSVKVSDSQSSYGSTAWKVNHSGQTFMLTAHHVVDDANLNDGVYGDGSPRSFDEIGGVYEYSSDLDIALIDTDRSIQNSIEGENNQWNIGGWVTESGISSRVTSPFDGYTAMGCTTGETNGGLGKYHIGGSYSNQIDADFGGHGVRGNANSAPGDSGGPSFSVHNGDAYLTHLVTHGDPKAGRQSYNNNCLNENPYKKGLGTAAYHLDPGYEVDGSSRS